MHGYLIHPHCHLFMTLSTTISTEQTFLHVFSNSEVSASELLKKIVDFFYSIPTWTVILSISTNLHTIVLPVVIVLSLIFTRTLFSLLMTSPMRRAHNSMTYIVDSCVVLITDNIVVIKITFLFNDITLFMTSHCYQINFWRFMSAIAINMEQVRTTTMSH